MGARAGPFDNFTSLLSRPFLHCKALLPFPPLCVSFPLRVFPSFPCWNRVYDSLKPTRAPLPSYLSLFSGAMSVSVPGSCSAPPTTQYLESWKSAPNSQKSTPPHLHCVCRECDCEEENERPRPVGEIRPCSSSGTLVVYVPGRETRQRI